MIEQQIEQALIEKLGDLKYTYRPDITDRNLLEQNFRQHFEALNCVNLTEGESKRLLEDIISSDVFTAARTLRERNSFTRDDGTPLNYTLVNIKDWCKNTFEVINQLRINTDNSHHRYDVIILINGVPVVQIELKTLGINPRRAMEQIVDYKNDHGNGYQFRKEEERYSKRVSMNRIAEEGYNLNISRYISTATAEKEIKLEAVNAELVTLEKDIESARDKHNTFLNELGLPALP